MKRRLLFLVLAGLLAAMLATPAAASPSQVVRGIHLQPGGMGNLTLEQFGNSCHVTSTDHVFVYTGDIQATCLGTYTVVERGLCSGGPGNAKMAFNLRSYRCVGTVLGRAGEFEMQGQGVFRPPDLETFSARILILGTGGDLIGMQGHLTISYVTQIYEGQVHFDPEG